MCSCGGNYSTTEYVEPKSDCTEIQIIQASKKPVSIKVFLDPGSSLDGAFIMNALNSFWREVGVTVERVNAPEEAKIGVVFVKGSPDCKSPVEMGRLQYKYWADMDDIIILENCFQLPQYKERFPSAISHALGNLMGIEEYPDFCSQGGLMRTSVARMSGTIPTRLAKEDKDSFYHRLRYSNSWEYLTICVKKATWEQGVYIPRPEEVQTVRFWADSKLSAVSIKSHLNKYFKLFGKKFEMVGQEEAEFVVKSWDSEYNTCSPMAITYRSLSEIQLKPEQGCLELRSDSELDATVVSHEVAHLFGVNHVPDWCGNAIMDPHLNPGPFFTPTDVRAWGARDVSSSVLERPDYTLYIKNEKATYIRRIEIKREL